MWLLLAALGCGDPEAEVAAPTRSPARPAPPSTVVDLGAARVQFTGVGALHRKFFADPVLVADLPAVLAGCVAGPIRLAVAWSEAEMAGSVWVEVDVGALRCAAHADGDALDLTALGPALAAVAGWRDRVAAGRDGRVASFRAGVVVRGGGGEIALWGVGRGATAGQGVEPCLDVDGARVCAAQEQPGLRPVFAEAGLSSRLAGRLGG